MGRTGVLTGAVGVVALAGVLVPGAGASAAPRAPAVPTQAPGGGLGLTLSATTGLRDRQTVDFEVTGLPQARDTVVEVWQCDDPVAPGTPIEVIAQSCTAAATVATDGQPMVSGAITVYEVYEVYPPDRVEVDACSDEPYDCTIVAYVRPRSGSAVPNLVGVPVDMVPGPVHVRGPGLGDPSLPVDVRVAGEPGATLRLAQCVRYPDVAHDLGSCLAGPEVVLSETGRATTQMTVAATQEVGGQTFDCRLRPCEVTVFDRAGTTVSAAGIPGSVPSAEITLDRTTGLASGSVLHARVDTREGGQYLAQCVASVLDGTVAPTDGCTLLHGSLLGPGPHELDVTVFEPFTSYSGVPDVTCADDPGGCVVAFGGDGTGVAWYVPISFAGPAAMSLSPTTGLLDGQEMAVELTGLAPGESYLLMRCMDEPSGWVGCEYVAGAPALDASADGTASATAPAAQRFDEGTYYCRDLCSIGVTLASQYAPVTRARYTMAEGSIAASPSTGLTDGQSVTVTGTDLMPSYAGPPFWVVQTGSWGIVQCDRAVIDDPTLVGVFTHCAAPPPGGPVEVPGSTLSLGFEVESTIDRVLGGTTDCTATSGACVIALGRVEQDGSPSVHTAPLTFGPPAG